MPSSLLTLPLELRNLIYEELLYAKPHIEPTSNDDRWPRDLGPMDQRALRKGGPSYLEWLQFSREHLYISTTNGVETDILRVNKQIHDEAVPFLYKHLDCHIIIDFSAGALDQIFELRQADGTVDEGDFRHGFTSTYACHRNGPAGVSEKHPYEDSPEKIANMTAQNMMNLGCLRLIRNVTIQVSGSRGFEQRGRLGESRYLPGPHPFSHTGHFIVQVLRCLNDEPMVTDSRPRTLRLKSNGRDSLKTLVKESGLWHSPYQRDSLPFESRLRSLQEGLAEMFRLLGGIKGRRSVTITEDIGEHDMVTQELDWEKFPWNEA